MPLLQRYALARPNARSSHRVPTPQGGGIAVLGAALPLAAIAALFIGLPDPAALKELAVVTVAAIALAVLGAWDDVRPLSATVRLAVQTLAVAAVVLAGGPESRVLFDLVPPWLEFVLLVVAGVWFVNLVNFMDGLDWMTVAEFVPALAFRRTRARGRRRPAAVRPCRRAAWRADGLRRVQQACRSAVSR